MTEKEKAEELVNRFWNTDQTKHRLDAVKDALICVDEKINLLTEVKKDKWKDDKERTRIFPLEHQFRIQFHIDYWQTVKLEIQKL